MDRNRLRVTINVFGNSDQLLLDERTFNNLWAQQTIMGGTTLGARSIIRTWNFVSVIGHARKYYFSWFRIFGRRSIINNDDSV